MIRRTRIKFCGITRVDDALAACALGVDAIGLVLTSAGRRCVTPALAREIRRALPPFVVVVALFMDDQPGFIADVVALVQPDLLQFHGGESQEECVRFDVPYIKAIAMAGGDAARALHEHTAATAFVLDAHAPGGQGGGGSVFDWARIPCDLPRPLILAGGLTCDNVGSAIRTVTPFAVDVSSGIEAGGIESVPGIKDAAKMRRFVEEVERADSKK